MTRILVLALLGGGCTPPPSAEAFQADPIAAQNAVDDCDHGRRRGEVCDHARAGLAKAKRDARMRTLRKGFE